MDVHWTFLSTFLSVLTWLWAEFLVESNFSSESWRHCSTRVTRVTTGEAEAIRFSFPYGLRFLWERVGSHLCPLSCPTASQCCAQGRSVFRHWAGIFPWWTALQKWGISLNIFVDVFLLCFFLLLFLLYYRILLGWLGLPGWFHNVLTIFYFLSPCLLRDFSNLMFQAFCSIFAASMLFWVVLLFFFNHLKFFSNFMDEVINSL